MRFASLLKPTLSRRPMNPARIAARQRPEKRSLDGRGDTGQDTPIKSETKRPARNATRARTTTCAKRASHQSGEKSTSRDHPAHSRTTTGTTMCNLNASTPGTQRKEHHLSREMTKNPVLCNSARRAKRKPWAKQCVPAPDLRTPPKVFHRRTSDSERYIAPSQCPTATPHLDELLRIKRSVVVTAAGYWGGQNHTRSIHRLPGESKSHAAGNPPHAGAKQEQGGREQMK